MPAPVTQKGFTLIEMLVALGVFSIAVIALLNVQSQSVRTLSEIELRAFAHIVADNRMVETLAHPETPLIGTERGETDLAGETWYWLEETLETGQPQILRVDVSVRRDEDGSVLAVLSAFRSNR